MRTDNIEVLDPLPGRHGGARAGAGRKPGYSPKRAAELAAGAEVESPADEDALQVVSYNEARARHEQAKADLAELDYKVKSREFVARVAVRQASATALSSLSQTLRSLPDRLERSFALAPEVVQEIADQIDAALNDLADEFEMMVLE